MGRMRGGHVQSHAQGGATRGTLGSINLSVGVQVIDQ
jgi:hypothetical protein